MDDEQCCRRNDGEWRRKGKDLSLSLRPVKMRIYVMPVYRGAKLVLGTVKQAGPRKGKGRVVPSFLRGPFNLSSMASPFGHSHAMR